jgi:hypothetical protein
MIHRPWLLTIFERDESSFLSGSLLSSALRPRIAEEGVKGWRVEINVIFVEFFRLRTI